MIINNLKLNIMSELKEEHLVFMSDEMYTPIHYKGMIVKQPYFEGKGNHSVAQLEAICEQFKEYCHQQAIIKQNCMKHIVSNWLSFPENKPEQFSWVLVTVKSPIDKWVEMAGFDGEKFQLPGRGDTTFVTHWMPIPAPACA